MDGHRWETKAGTSTASCRTSRSISASDPISKEPNNKQFMPTGMKSKYHGTDGPIHTSFNDFYQQYEEE